MKRFLALLAMVSIILTVFSIQGFAANTTDTKFDFRLPAEGYYTVLNSGRRKLDASSTYVHYYSSNTGKVYFSVHGYNSNKYTNIALLNNCTINESAIIYPGQKRRIRQYVYELGYDYAFLGGAPSTGRGNTYIDGVWSPDCAGSYPAAN